jgi:hypothetical protein
VSDGPIFINNNTSNICCLRHLRCLQEEARAKADAVAKAHEEQKRKAEQARAAAVEAARKKQVRCCCHLTVMYTPQFG